MKRMKQRALSIVLAIMCVLAMLISCGSKEMSRTQDELTGESDIRHILWSTEDSVYPVVCVEASAAGSKVALTTAVSGVGDINGDGRLSIADIVLLNAYTKGKVMLSDDAKRVSDCTGNGVINDSDVIYLQGLVLGHTLEISKEGKLPTCTQSGLTEEISCSSCQKVLAVQGTMKATGHTFVDGECHCGAAVSQVCITYADNGDGTTTAKFSIEGDVNMAMIELQLSFALENASYSDYEILIGDGSAEANYDDGIFYFSYMSVNDVTEDTDLFEVTFTNVTDDIGITVTVVDSCISDGTFENITAVHVVGTTYKTYDR